MANTDFRHLNALRGTYGNLDACVNTISTQTGATIEYPLDKDIREFLEKYALQRRMRNTRYLNIPKI